MTGAQAGSDGDGRAARRTRRLLAERPDPPASRPLLAFRAAVYALGGALLSFVALGSARNVAADFGVTSTWRPAEARILQVRAAGLGGRGEYLFHLRLEADVAGGSPAQGFTLRPVAVGKSWSAPLQPPIEGDRLLVYLDPTTPGRMMPAEAVGARWWALALLPLLGGCAIFSLARAARCTTMLLLRRRVQGSSGA